MVAQNRPLEKLAELARSLYDRDIRTQVEPAHDGEFIVINLDTGEYEIDADELAANQRARARFPDAPLFMLRIGRSAAYRLGGSDLRSKS